MEGTRSPLRCCRDAAGPSAVARRSPACSHFWIIEAAMGAISRGACSICGEERLFRNNPLPSEFAQFKAIHDGHDGNGRAEPGSDRDYHLFQMPRKRHLGPRVV